ncbi:MAG: tetraspanin family protein [Candidatus Azobacteroides sp.]|nr:tetraspanin family protein [Candidatus Azobacteroides sp.]
MTKSTKTPNFIKFLYLAISIICFGFGTLHTYLGFRVLNIGGSVYGSIFLAVLILMALITCYYYAIKGKKLALVFYLVFAMAFFISNLNYFYPQYSKNSLIKEEAGEVKNILNNYKEKIDKEVNPTQSDYLRKLQELNDHKTSLIREIRDRGGFGIYATKELEQFNKLAGSSISPDRDLGKTDAEREEKALHFEKELNNAIKTFEKNTLKEQDQAAIALFEAKDEMNEKYMYYSDTLLHIVKDKININLNDIDSVPYIPEIKVITEIVDFLDAISVKVNTAKDMQLLTPFEKDKKGALLMPTVKNLGRAEHTINSIIKRRDKGDTWVSIILCFFIDIIIPLFMYFVIRKNSGEETDAGNEKRKGSGGPKSLGDYKRHLK